MAAAHLELLFLEPGSLTFNKPYGDDSFAVIEQVISPSPLLRFRRARDPCQWRDTEALKAHLAAPHMAVNPIHHLLQFVMLAVFTEIAIVVLRSLLGV
jgi:hypothetical protein